MITLHFHLQPQYTMNFIYISHHFTAREDMNSTNWPRSYMCGSTAQLGEHRTCVAEVTGSNPVEALIFFRLLPSNCLNWKIYCDHSSLSPMLEYWHPERRALKRHWCSAKFLCELETKLTESNFLLIWMRGLALNLIGLILLWFILWCMRRFLLLCRFTLTRFSLHLSILLLLKFLFQFAFYFGLFVFLLRQLR